MGTKATICDDIPIPPRNNGSALLETMKELKAGQSFDAKEAYSGKALGANVYSMARRLGYKVAIRGTRVWRVS